MLSYESGTLSSPNFLAAVSEWFGYNGLRQYAMVTWVDNSLRVHAPEQEPRVIYNVGLNAIAGGPNAFAYCLSLLSNITLAMKVR